MHWPSVLPPLWRTLSKPTDQMYDDRPSAHVDVVICPCVDVIAVNRLLIGIRHVQSHHIHRHARAQSQGQAQAQHRSPTLDNVL